MSRFTRILLACALLLASLLGGGGALAAGRSPDLVPGLPVYLALGDSIANGQQSSAVVPGDYWATVAGWRANGYVAQFHQDLRAELDCVPGVSPHRVAGCRQLQLLNLARSAVPAMGDQPAKPGVTTPLLISEQLPLATELLAARNGDANRRNNVEVITLTVGGNDAFGPITSACLTADTSNCLTTIGTVFASFAANYAQVLAQLRTAGGPGVRIITMTYYNPVPFCGLGQLNPQAGPFVDWVLEGGSLPGVGQLGSGYNDLIRQISAQFGATPAETFGALGSGDYVGGADCLHPNLAGQTKIADTFAAAFAG